MGEGESQAYSLVHCMHLSQLLGSCCSPSLHLLLQEQEYVVQAQGVGCQECVTVTQKNTTEWVIAQQTSPAALSCKLILCTCQAEGLEPSGRACTAQLQYCSGCVVTWFVRCPDVVCVVDPTLRESSMSSLAAASCLSRSFSSARRASYSPSSCSAADRCSPSSSFRICVQHRRHRWHKQGDEVHTEFWFPYEFHTQSSEDHGPM